MGILGRLRTYFSRQWRRRRAYVTTGSWLLSIYNRAMLARPSVRWPGKGVVAAVRLRNFPGNYYVRLGTSDFWVLEEIFLEHEYDPLFNQPIGDLHTILDLGANVGFSIRLWLSRFPTARVVAVEPDAGNIQMAGRNTAGRKGVSLLRACVAGRPRWVALDRSAAEWAFKIQEGPNHHVGKADLVEAFTVPQIMERFGLAGPIDLLKCDIEGAELEVFADCSSWIGRVRNLVVELHAPYVEEQFLADLRRGGVNPMVDGRIEKEDRERYTLGMREGLRRRTHQDRQKVVAQVRYVRHGAAGDV